MPRQKKQTAPTTKIEVIEDKQEVARMKTWYSLDRATGGGLPLFTFDEVSGWPMTGKSSMVTALAGMINPKGTVLYAPFEPYSSEYIQRGLLSVGFSGRLIVVSNVSKNKPRRPEEVLDEMCDSLANEDVSAVIWDSIGATPTTAVLEGSVGDSNMGKPAIMIKFAIQKCNWHLSERKTPAKAFATNHCHVSFGSKGTTTNGGMAVMYNTGVRIRLSRLQDDLKNEVFFVQGRVDRLKFKPQSELEENFWMAISPHTGGFHRGLTAVIDCEKYGLVERDNGVIKKGNKSFGRLSAMCDKAEDESVFAPFMEMLDA